MSTQEKQREDYKKLVTMRYLGHQDYLAGYYEAPDKEDFINGIVDLIDSATREARKDELNELWKLVPPIATWDSEESVRNSWLWGLLGVRLRQLEQSEEEV